MCFSFLLRNFYNMLKVFVLKVLLLNLHLSSNNERLWGNKTFLMGASSHHNPGYIVTLLTQVALSCLDSWHAWHFPGTWQRQETELLLILI